MDMNRYLIVVFCVLTGCAAAVPLANGQDLTVDHQLFANWYADHIQNIDESYSSTILAHTEQDQFAGKYIPNIENISLLENLPKFPVENQVVPLGSIPIWFDYHYYLVFRDVLIGTIPDGDFHIRAPVLA
ncbi:hypothetical protein BZG01_09255 [Labilibaculum manganireducens]|uniref:DUF3299 domain-containing protein n=2 Tax=Labilibaculum manganireducens TaxID=1940525 RepID=A0A2N3I9J5_9BACT|nr:hypothetical protein BZG01_09255 [Labilibaculum manganireducens]